LVLVGGLTVARKLVLACGNTLRGDDGVGWAIAEQLEGDSSLSDVEVVIAHQLTPEMAEPISLADTVIFVDCSAVSAPGEVSVFPVEAARNDNASLTHNVDPSNLLALAEEIFASAPRRAFAVTVGGKSFELAAELTESVRLAIPAAILAIRSLLN
jgi:hydrogenase maturation protease